MPNAVQYRIYTRVDSETGSQTVNAAPSSTGSNTHIIDGLPLGPVVYFSVTSIDSSGRESRHSNQRYITYEVAAQVVDSDSDGLTDAEEDRNLNGQVDADETDPAQADSDGDGWSDGYERDVTGTDPLDRDSDNDGVLDGLDDCHDIDGDGYGVADSAIASCPSDNCIFDHNPDQRDSDSDGHGEACDPCTNIGGLRDMLDRHQLKIGQVNLDRSRSYDRLSFKGDFILPTDSNFALLAPAAYGARIVLQSVGGSSWIEINLPDELHPGGRRTRGWKYLPSHKAWKYTDRTSFPVNGIRKLIFKDKSRKQPRRVRVSVKGRGGDYPISTEDLPLRASVTLGDSTAALAGECGESAFLASDCQFNRRQRNLVCQRKS